MKKIDVRNLEKRHKYIEKNATKKGARKTAKGFCK